MAIDARDPAERRLTVSQRLLAVVAELEGNTPGEAERIESGDDAVEIFVGERETVPRPDGEDFSAEERLTQRSQEPPDSACRASAGGPI